MKEAATRSDATPTSIVTEIVARSRPGFAASIGRTEALKQIARRERRKAGAGAVVKPEEQF